MEQKRPKIFVGSSSEKLDIAETLVMLLDEFAEATLWRDIMQPGISILDSLVNKKDSFDFAILIITADDVLTSRGDTFNVPRDNIIFELGLFTGSIGNDRVFALKDRHVDTKILSDYSGITYINYDLNRDDGDIASSLRPCCAEIKRTVKNIST